MQYKMICSDLDGTLLNNQSEVAQENLRAIDKLVQKGVYFIPSTGRAYMEMPEALRKSESIRYYICSNGAILYDKLTNQTYTTCVPKEETRKILDILKPYDVHITVRKDGQSYVDAELLTDEVFDYYRMFEAHRFVLHHFGVKVDDFEKICDGLEYVDFFTLVFYHVEDAIACKEQIEMIGGLWVARIDANALEVMSIRAGKGNALRTLAEMLDVDLSDTICIGDSDNDRSIMETAGLGLAVSNASDSLKEIADQVICSNEEHAIAYVLEHYFESGK